LLLRALLLVLLLLVLLLLLLLLLLWDDLQMAVQHGWKVQQSM
jgi:uncharacterized membrane protein YsdA (DUF1294 family)